MSAQTHERLKSICFEGELLPDWAQLLDLAAILSGVSQDTRLWFLRFTNCSGVDDARTVLEECNLLLTRIHERRNSIAAELRQSRGDEQVDRMIAAWIYSLDTMIQVAHSRKTCSWLIEGTENTVVDDLVEETWR